MCSLQLSAALLRPRAPSPAGLLLLLAPRPRRRRPPPRPRPPPQLPTPQVLLHGARPEPRAGELTRNSSAWQHLGVGLVEVLQREQHLDVVVVVAVVVIAAIVVCVLERNGGRARGERARRVRAAVTSARDARAYRNVLIVTMIVDALVTSAMNPCWLWKSPWPPPAYPGGSGTPPLRMIPRTKRPRGGPAGSAESLGLPKPPARAGAVHPSPPANPAAAGAAAAQPICFLFFYKMYCLPAFKDGGKIASLR